MITVAILINDKCIAKHSAVRVDTDTYEADGGHVLRHKFSDGAKPLAKQLLELMYVPTKEEYVADVLSKMVSKMVERATRDAEVNAKGEK